jgi:hypothetical protein
MVTEAKKSVNKKLLNRKSVILAIVLAIAVILEITNTTHLFHKKPPAVSQGVSLPSRVSNSTSPSSTTDSQGQPVPATNSKATAGASTTPQAPTGTFVSNHRPSLSGNTLSRQEKSVCNAAVNSTCYIVFTKDSITKKLPVQTIDSSGSTYWTWDVNQLGLAQGSWTVSAVATLNDQSLTGQDSLLLEVQQ